MSESTSILTAEIADLRAKLAESEASDRAEAAQRREAERALALVASERDALRARLLAAEKERDDARSQIAGIWCGLEEVEKWPGDLPDVMVGTIRDADGTERKLALRPEQIGGLVEGLSKYLKALAPYGAAMLKDHYDMPLVRLELERAGKRAEAAETRAAGLEAALRMAGGFDWWASDLPGFLRWVAERDRREAARLDMTDCAADRLDTAADAIDAALSSPGSALEAALSEARTSGYREGHAAGMQAACDGETPPGWLAARDAAVRAKALKDAKDECLRLARRPCGSTGFVCADALDALAAQGG